MLMEPHQLSTDVAELQEILAGPITQKAIPRAKQLKTMIDSTFSDLNRKYHQELIKLHLQTQDYVLYKDYRGDIEGFNRYSEHQKITIDTANQEDIDNGKYQLVDGGHGLVGKILQGSQEDRSKINFIKFLCSRSAGYNWNISFTFYYPKLPCPLEGEKFRAIDIWYGHDRQYQIVNRKIICDDASCTPQPIENWYTFIPTGTR